MYNCMIASLYAAKNGDNCQEHCNLLRSTYLGLNVYVLILYMLANREQKHV